MVLASGQRIGVVVSAADAYQLFYLVVIGCDLFVVYRPGDTPPVAFGRFEIEVGVSKTDPSPYIGLAAYAPDPYELKWPIRRSDVRLFSRAQEDVGWAIALPGSLAMLVGQKMNPELLFVEALARIQHQNTDASSCQIPCRHPTGRTRPYHYDIVDLWLLDYLHLINLKRLDVYGMAKTIG